MTIPMATSINRLVANGVFRNHPVLDRIFRNRQAGARHKTALLDFRLQFPSMKTYIGRFFFNRQKSGPFREVQQL